MISISFYLNLLTMTKKLLFFSYFFGRSPQSGIQTCSQGGCIFFSLKRQRHWVQSQHLSFIHWKWESIWKWRVRGSLVKKKWYSNVYHCSTDGGRMLRSDSMSLCFQVVSELHPFCSIWCNSRLVLTYICNSVQLQIFLPNTYPSIFKC